MALTPLDRPPTQSELVAESIRKAILDGRLEPDEVLVERRLAQMLGVSKTPVREALIALSRSGLVTDSRSRGMRVRQPGVADARKIYELRMLLEPWAGAAAARLRPPRTLEDARAALREAEAAIAAGDHARLSIVNRRFHRVLCSACENELVVSKINELQDLTALITVSLLWERWPKWNQEFTEHQEIYSAAERGDTTAVEQLMREHIQRSVERLGKSEIVEAQS